MEHPTRIREHILNRRALKPEVQRAFELLDEAWLRLEAAERVTHTVCSEVAGFPNFMRTKDRETLGQGIENVRQEGLAAKRAEGVMRYYSIKYIRFLEEEARMLRNVVKSQKCEPKACEKCRESEEGTGARSKAVV